MKTIDVIAALTAIKEIFKEDNFMDDYVAALEVAIDSTIKINAVRDMVNKYSPSPDKIENE